MVAREELAVDAHPHFVAFGDEDKLVPFFACLPRGGNLFCLQKRFEIGGDFRFRGEGFVAAFPVLEIHDAGLVIDEGDAFLTEDRVAEMTGVNAFHLAVDETKLEGFLLIEPGKLETNHNPAILKTGYMMNVGGMSGLLRGAGDL